MRPQQLFRDVVVDLTKLADLSLKEASMLERATPLMQDLLASDHWIPEKFCEANPDRYQQYLLHCDPLERFSIVSFVWGPGQETPIHDHTVWGLLGVLRGCEVGQKYAASDGVMHESGALEYMEAGFIDSVSPTIGDIHKVRNGLRNRPSVSIHLYGGNIGQIRRHAYTDDGNVKAFTSGYSLDVIPNLWS